MHVKAFLLAATAGAALTAAPAFAQTTSGPAANDPAQAQGTTSSTEAGPEPGGIPDIVVTARRIEERLQDTPVSVSVITSSTINEQGLDSIQDFARQATGVSFSQAFGRSTDRPVIRGQSNVLAGVQAGVETGAAYFIDGIYYQGDIQGFDPQAIERVEIIKGPQSALYGRNTYAGAINYITRDPSNELTVSGRLRAAQHDEYEASVSVSGPILPTLGFRAGARYFTYGGEYRNQLTGRNVGQEETLSANLTLLWEPTPDIRIRPRIYYQRDDDGPLAIFLQGASDNNCLPGFRSAGFRQGSAFTPTAPATLTSTNTNQYYCGVIRPQPNNVRLNTDPIDVGAPFGVRDGTAYDGVYNEQVNITNVFEWDIAGSGWVLSSLTGYRDNLNRFGTDSDHSNHYGFFPGTPLAATVNAEPAFANTNRDDQQDFSQEIRINSPLDRPLRFKLGGYYYRQTFQSVDITFASGEVGRPLGTDLSTYSTISNRAIFGMVQWQPIEPLTISAELRYAEERKTQIDRSSATSIFCAGESGRAGQFGFTGTCQPEAVFDGWDPRLTVDYQVAPNLLLYGVVARGRKPGGFNGTAGVTAATVFNQPSYVGYLPEVSTGGELGVKWDSADRRIRIALAGFYNELSDVQLTSSIPNPGAGGALTSIVTNAGDARTLGFEFEGRIIPARGYDLSLGVSYVDAKFTRGCDSDEFIFRSGGLRPNFDTTNPTPAGLALCDITGRRLPLGSPWQVNGSFSYDTLDLPGTNANVFTNMNFSYEASKYVQVHNQAETGDSFILNARIGIRTPRFTVALFGRNLTDEDSIPLATRWFDLRYGFSGRGLPTAPQVFDGRAAVIETGNPRAFFATLRKGRTFGIEATFNF